MNMAEVSAVCEWNIHHRDCFTPIKIARLNPFDGFIIERVGLKSIRSVNEQTERRIYSEQIHIMSKNRILID